MGKGITTSRRWLKSDYFRIEIESLLVTAEMESG